ncbi:ABC transporter permease [Bacillus sp. FJAT-44742]|uniref:ABC transporter permease n=1 Tax=Bacillus sp. FJAT-44742 TaxID=2014005 RepID=UPI000C24AA4A|nr:ABC transporter permease [Bacillus sp. FJAT-44742]
MKVHELWGHRSQTFWSEAVRYLRLIGNSGFVFTLYVLFLMGGYYYSSFLEWLPPAFPAVLFFSVLFALLLTRSPIRTFLKEGDLVFLLPVETQLTSYFRKSLIYTFIMQLFFIALLFMVLGPLFLDRIHPGTGYLFTVLLWLAAGKWWNLISRWAEMRIQSVTTRDIHIGLRFLVNVTFTFFLFSAAPVVYPLVIMGAMVFVYLFYYQKLHTQHGLKWQHVLEMEERMVSFFYRIANSFTDVPHLKSSVKGRLWASKWVDKAAHNKTSVYTYLYGKTFIRANDYFGIYVRLFIVGSLVMSVIPSDLGRGFLAVLFIYMTGLQLSTLWNHYDVKIWTDLYPVRHTLKKQSFTFIIERLLWVQALLFGVILGLYGVNILILITALAAGVVFSSYYARKLVFKKRKAA